LKYDPHSPVDPEAWLALDESERIHAVTEYHRRRRIRLPNRTLHAAIHVIVESQVALGDKHPASSVLARLMREGLDRHEAIHAIGSALAGQLFNVLKQRNSETDIHAEYLERLNRLTAESWRKQSS
jgi:hypothetical protein